MGVARSMVALAALCCGCAGSTHTFEVDGSFTDDERQALREAAATWNSLGANLPAYSPLQLNFLSTSVDDGASAHTIVPGNASGGAVKLGSAHRRHMRFVGETLVDQWLVNLDRDAILNQAEYSHLSYRRVFGLVATHELGHTIGMLDLTNSDSIMCGLVAVDLDGSCPQTGDLVEFCRVMACDPEELPPCDGQQIAR
jgi:hypothetical protein